MEDLAYQDVCYVATSGEVPQPFDRETMNKLHIEARRAEDSSRHKFEEEKRARKAQEKLMHEERIHKMKRHAKTKTNQPEEHRLSKAFSGSIEAAQLCINNKATSAVDSSHKKTASALDSALGQLKDGEQQQQLFAHHMAKALKDDQLDFSMTDTKHSGAQRLSTSIKSVTRAVSAGDEELAREQAEWNKVDAELRRSTEELFGKQGCDLDLSHDSNYCEPQNAEMREGTEKILREARESLGHASQSTLKELEGVDEAYRARQRELDYSFRTLLNDDEY